MPRLSVVPSCARRLHGASACVGLIAACLLLTVGCRPASDAPPVQKAEWPAVFVRFGPDLAVPLGCYDPDEGRLVGGRSCVQRVAMGDAVYAADLAGGATAEEVMGAHCRSRRGGQTALRLAPAGGGAMKAAAPATPVVWPAKRADIVERRPIDNGPADVSGGLEDEIRNAMAAVGAPKDAFVRQLVAVDLNADGKRDHIAALAAGSPGQGFGALLVSYGKGPFEVVHKSGSTWFGVDATTDLDADGKREVWVRAEKGESFDNTLEVWRGTQVSVVGRWGCE